MIVEIESVACSIVTVEFLCIFAQATNALDADEVGNEHDREIILCEKRLARKKTEKCRDHFIYRRPIGHVPLPLPRADRWSSGQ